MAYVQVRSADGVPTGITDYDEIAHTFKVRCVPFLTHFAVSTADWCTCV